MAKSILKSLAPAILTLAGIVIAITGLAINQQFPVMLAIGSLVSPTGAQVTLSGLRIKHWLTGIIIGIVAIYLYSRSDKNKTFRNISYIMFGAGGFLIFDEYMDILRFVTTGQYP